MDDTTGTGTVPEVYTSMGGPYGGSGKSAREVIFHPIMFTPIPIAVLFVVGRYVGFVADQPLWMLLGALFLAQALSLVIAIAFPPGTARARPLLHLAAETVAIGLIVYVTGWGATLAVGFVFAAAGHMASGGARLGVAAIIISCVTITVGEIAIALGFLDTLVPEPVGHGLAVLEAAGVCAVVWMMAYLQREKEEIQAAERQSERRLFAYIEHAYDAIIVLSPDLTATFVSPALRRLLGFGPEDVVDVEEESFHEDYREMARATFADLLERPGGTSRLELPIKGSDGEFRWFEVGLTNRLRDPSVAGIVCNLRDVTERRQVQEQLTFEAHHDALTRLPNRWRFLDRLDHALQTARRNQTSVAVLFLDVDRFKMVNDSLGHDVGDRMLVEVAARLETCLRPGDTVARFGGDEFTVLLENLDGPEPALAVADRIVDLLHEPLRIDDYSLFVSASIGVAIAESGFERPNDLLRQADLAMYMAKEKGRGRWALYDASSAPPVVERLELEGDLWRALDNGELQVHFQPWVAIGSGDVIGAEALLRWEHPRRGYLEPDKFIPLAEESSLIVAVDRYVLREACGWAKTWAARRGRHSAPFVVSVNLSPRFMHQPDVVAEIRNVLQEAGTDPRLLQLEITERTALTDLEATCAALHQIRATGTRVAVDDFGTGYSSLSYLKALPIDVLKLDKSFVDGLEDGGADHAIVHAIVTMGHALGVQIAAEGVERPQQAALLEQLGCDSAMGWLWSKALPAERIAEVIASGFAPRGGTDGAVVVPLRSQA